MADAEAPVGSIERRSEALQSPANMVSYWLAQIRAADKQEKDWRKEADEAVKRYNGKSGKTEAFNILHSNVATISPAVYNSTPIPDIRPRHQPPAPSNDPAKAMAMEQRRTQQENSRKAAQILEAGISYSLDEYDFDASLKTAVLDNNVCGRGVTRVRYKTYSRQDKDAGEQLQWEEVVCEHVPWRLFRRGPGTNWDDVSWIAFKRFYDLDELDTLTGDSALAEAVPRDVTDELDSESDKKSQELNAFKKAEVWEIWDRESRKVYFICEGYSLKPLLVDDDPYGLKDFFPVPRPLQAISDPDTMTPIVPFEIYHKPAEELVRVSERILSLIGMLKVRGIAASELAQLGEIMNLEDGEFVFSKQALTLLTGGNVRALDAALWFVPIDKVIVVIRELVLQRNEIKQQIYEITGIADIMRGVTSASETLGAQQIKASWGSLRVQDQQREIQRYCRDIFRMKGELIGNKFSAETLSVMVGEPVSPEIIAILRNDVRRGYLIDIESDSTIRADLTRSQEQMGSFLTGTAQFWQSFIPLIQSGQLPPVVAKAAIVIFSAFARQFRLGKQVEDALAELTAGAEEMPPPGQQPVPGQAQQAQQPQSPEMAANDQRRAQAIAAQAEANAQAAQHRATGAQIGNAGKLQQIIRQAQQANGGQR